MKLFFLRKKPFALKMFILEVDSVLELEVLLPEPDAYFLPAKNMTASII